EEELPGILWSYHTTPRIATGETPYLLAFGTEAVIPVDIGLSTSRVEEYDPTANEDGLKLNLDLLPERRDMAELRMAAHHQRASNYFNKKVRSKIFQVGDLVLRNAAAAGHHVGKLDPKWE